MQGVRDEFRIGRMLDLVEARDPRTGGATRALYDRTSDFGAHPNEMALLTVLRRTDDEASVRFDLDYLSDDSTPALALCLKTNAQVGVCSLRVFRLVVPERFDLLGLTDELANLSAGLCLAGREVESAVGAFAFPDGGLFTKTRTATLGRGSQG